MRTQKPRLRAGLVLAVCAVLALLAYLAWWLPTRSDTPDLLPPAASVQRLLELRLERSTDASAFAQVVREPSVVEGLVAASREETVGAEPIPDWETPYVSEEATSTALVIVVWERSAEDTAWPEATGFSMEYGDGRWRVVDALPLEGDDVPVRR